MSIHRVTYGGQVQFLNWKTGIIPTIGFLKNRKADV